jgi:transcriptional regulator with XRE-family HTH domain
MSTILADLNASTLPYETAYMTFETASSSGLSARLVGVVLCLRAARSLLGWNQKVLAERAGVSESAVNRLERFDREPRLDTISKIETAFANAGVEFESRPDGKLQLVLAPSVIEEMTQRIDDGGDVTSRGRIGSKASPRNNGTTATKRARDRTGEKIPLSSTQTTAKGSEGKGTLPSSRTGESINTTPLKGKKRSRRSGGRQ